MDSAAVLTLPDGNDTAVRVRDLLQGDPLQLVHIGAAIASLTDNAQPFKTFMQQQAAHYTFESLPSEGIDSVLAYEQR